MAPDSLLFDRFKNASEVRFVNSSGIVPFSWLLETSNDSSVKRFPRLLGIDLMSKLLERFKLYNPVNEPISLGIEPDILFPDRSREMTNPNRYFK